jgi:hypothetical protein
MKGPFGSLGLDDAWTFAALRLEPWALAALAAAMAVTGAARGDAPSTEEKLNVVQWSVMRRQSGPVNYYQPVLDPQMPFVRAQYHPPDATTVLGFQILDSDRKTAARLRWQWRAQTLPHGGDECVAGKRDSAAVVYATWKALVRWYTLKYVWSAVGARGALCDPKRSPFLAQDTIILESGGPTGLWRHEDIDLKAEFRRHFDDGDPHGEVADFVGVAIMTDGDDTKSESAADYADFVLVR